MQVIVLPLAKVILYTGWFPLSNIPNTLHILPVCVGTVSPTLISTIFLVPVVHSTVVSPTTQLDSLELIVPPALYDPNK